MRPPAEPLSLRWLMTVHVILVKRYGGGIGVRDVGLIDSALHRPLTSYRGEYKYKTAFARAGALWVALIRNHGFVDGNKRTATAAMTRWLLAEGYRLKSDQDQLVDAAVAIANKHLDEADAAKWLETHSKRVRR